MVDNGQNGDQQPSDKVFTASFALLEQTTGQLDFVVSAALRGSLRRILSLPITLTVASATQQSLAANGINLRYPSDFVPSTHFPLANETYTLTNRPPNQTGGADVSLGCSITISTNTKILSQSMDAWIAANSRTGGLDSYIAVGGTTTALRKDFVADITNQPAVLIFIDKSDRIHVLSAVGASCISVLDNVLQSISF